MVKHYIFEAAFIRTGLVKLIDGVNAVCLVLIKLPFLKLLMETLNDIIITTLNSFDFAFCITVNVLTYIINTIIIEMRGKNTSRWSKRVILLCCIVFMSGAWYISTRDIKLVMNSAILAPVFWTWIVKPLCAKLGLDYKEI